MRASIALVCAGLLATTTAVSACPDLGQTALAGHITLNEGFEPDPYRQPVLAGGGFNLAQCGFDFAGWVAAAPDFDLTYNTSGATQLTFAVESTTDTILLVNDPNGEWWYDDDGAGDGGGAAIVVPNASSGLYNIWIGVFNQEGAVPGDLVITELDY